MDLLVELQHLKSVRPLSVIMMGGDHNTKKTMAGAQESVWCTPRGRSAYTMRLMPTLHCTVPLQTVIAYRLINSCGFVQMCIETIIRCINLS